MHLKKKEWERSYRNRQNYLFYPDEELIRFCAKYLRKRIDINKFITLSNSKRVLCLGCGIGRHVLFFDEMHFEAYGIDLSENAIKKAKAWVDFLGKSYLKKRFICGSADKDCFPDCYFDVIVSHGVLDSMPFALAKKVTQNAERMLTNNGYFYLDLISGDSSSYSREFAGEVVVKKQHEKGTIQSYFNLCKIKELIKNSSFSIIDCLLIKEKDILNGSYGSRYYITLKKEIK